MNRPTQGVHRIAATALIAATLWSLVELDRPSPSHASGLAQSSAAQIVEPEPHSLVSQSRLPGWTYRLRLWNDLGRAYALQGLPPPIPSELRAAIGGAEGDFPTARRAPSMRNGERLNVLLLGSDRREAEGLWRTDTIILATVDLERGHVGLISIPRDLWVSIPGYGAGRINTADYLGEARGLPDGQLIKDTVALNLGLPVEHFLRVDLQGFVAVIDALGGVEVALDCHLEDRFYDPESLGGEVVLDLESGLHLLDGETALRVSRSRWGSSDFDRSRRQQRVLRALAAKLDEPGFAGRIPEIYRALSPHMQTDVGLSQVPRLALYARRWEGRPTLSSAVLGHPATLDWTTPDGAQVLLLEPRAATAVIERAWLPQADASAAAEPALSLALLDATDNPDHAALAALRAREAGIPVTDSQALPPGPQSMLFHAAEGEALAQELAQALGLRPDQVRPSSAWPGRPPAEANLWLHLGRDWQACPEQPSSRW